MIREATQDDYRGLCEVFEEVDILHCEAIPHVFQRSHRPARTEEFISDVITNDDEALFVAEYDDQIIGIVQISIREAPDIPIMVPRRYAVITNLAVKEKFRRSGIGRSLVEKAHRWAMKKGATQIELNVWEFNRPAIAFYEKLGYATATRRMWRWLDR